MRILITGAGGQLGRALIAQLQPNHRVLPLAHHHLEITDYADCQGACRALEPELVIHAAAWTDVDACEREPNRCYRVNTGGAWNMAAAAAASDPPAAFMLISTDFVFDGFDRDTPYHEQEPTHPLSSYGAAKDWAETAAWETNPRTYIVRTQWLYGPGGKNFAGAILAASSRDGPIQVVADQFGAPTSCQEAARQIEKILATPRYGIYHVNNAGEATWYTFAVELYLAAGLNPSRLRAIPGHEWPSPVRRPTYSVLARAAQGMLGLDDARPWEEDAQAYAAAWRAPPSG